MEGAGRGRLSRRAQATIEFAFSAPLLLLCLFGAVDSAAWALQNSSAVAAAEKGARLAASAVGTPVGQAAPNSAQLTAGVIAQLRTAMFATTVTAWPRQGCPGSSSDVEAAVGARTIVVCVQEHDPPACSRPPTPTNPGVPAYCGESPTITVRVVGFMASLVPPSFGLGWHGGEIPLDVRATTHVLRFAT
jgi:Flp pilus assembly protein TadG